MVSVALIVTGAIVAAVLGFTIYFRRELGETGTQIGGGLGALGKGLQQFGAGAGGGIGQFISGAFSPKIRPEFVPTIGIKTEFPELPPWRWFPSSAPQAAPDDRQGGRTENVNVQTLSRGREGIVVGHGRSPIGSFVKSTDRQGARTERLGGLELREAQLRGGFFK